MVGCNCSSVNHPNYYQMSMDLWIIISVVIGGTGFWRLIEVLIKYRLNAHRTKAEAMKHNALSQNSIVSNWVQWSQMLEKRVKESEEHSEKMDDLVEKQRKKILCLERKVRELEKHNKELLDKLQVNEE